MMVWAVMSHETFDGRERIHVVPTDQSGEDAKKPHVLNLNCSCQPAIDETGLIIHEQIQ